MNTNNAKQAVFNRGLTREEAVILVKAGCESIMCLEYGDGDVDENGQPLWVGLSIEDINENDEFDSDLMTFEFWGEETDTVLEALATVD